MSSIVRIEKKLKWILEGRKISQQAVPAAASQPIWCGATERFGSRINYLHKNALAGETNDLFDPKKVDLSRIDFEKCRP